MIRLTMALFALVALTACETMEGAGRDISTAGETITDGSQQVQSDM